MVRNWKNIVLQLLIILGIISGLIFLERNNQLRLSTKFVPFTGPDYIVMGVQAIKMTTLGQPQAILNSPKVIHFPDDTSNLTKPDILFYQQNGSPWHIQANYGQATNGDQKVVIWDNVRIQELPEKGNDGMILFTSQMTFYPNTSLAQTDQPVKIVQGDSLVNAVGFKADLKQGIIQLLSQVKEQYASDSKYATLPK